MIIKGDPDRLEEYTAITLPTLPPVQADTVDYGSLVDALNRAPSSIEVGARNWSGWIDSQLSIVERIDQRPAAFGFALRQLDHFVPETPRDRDYLQTSDLELFDALVAARLAHPADPAADVYELALDSITGTPQQLADEVGAVISDITDSMDADDIHAMQDQLRELWSSLEQSNVYRSPPLTDLEMVRQTWVILSGTSDDHTVPAALVQRLETLTDHLGRRRFEPTYTTAFYEALGPDNTALLPRAIALSSWSNFHQTAGEPTFDIQNVLANVGSALGTASPSLDTAWRDELFSGASHDGTLDDAFPLMFRYGHFSTPFATSVGQLGIDVERGEVVVDRGMGSPGYRNFDHLATYWEDRGTVLIAAAARTPHAANALLRNEDNAAWITSDKFGREGDDARHPPDWNVIGSTVRSLIVSGTVHEADVHPSQARDAAANVINAALEVGPGDASQVLSPAYGQMVTAYLPDFARSPAFDLSAANRGDHISIGSMQAAQFTSLAMQDDRSRTDIFAMRDALDLQTVVVGLESETPLHPPWTQRLANIDGIILSADNGEVFVAARQQDADARRYNENVDLFQGFAMGVIGLAKYPGSGLVNKAIDKGFDQLQDGYFHRDTNNAEHAGYTTNVAGFTALDRERLVIAEGQLIVAVRIEQSGEELTPEQADFIRYAEQELGRPYVDGLRDAANGAVGPAAPVDPRRLQEWAGTTAIDDGFTDVSNYSDLVLPHDGSSLWPH